MHEVQVQEGRGRLRWCILKTEQRIKDTPHFILCTEKKKTSAMHQLLLSTVKFEYKLILGLLLIGS